MLLEVFIIQKGTSFLLLHRSFTKHKFSVNEERFSKIIIAISQFISELNIGEFKFFDTGSHRILVNTYNKIYIVGVVEEKKEDPFVKKSLTKISEQFCKKFNESLDSNPGDLSVYQNFIPIIDEIVYSEFTNFYISKDFPKHVISAVRKIQQRFEPEIIRYMGTQTGLKRGSLEKDNRKFKRRLTHELNQFSLNSISEPDKSKFMIEILMCPFCRGIKDPSFSCKFFEGFIEGYANGSSIEKNFKVQETECIAKGSKSCIFELTIN
ncbi:MAG: methanogen output domain 1-containing protein [Promethearchaeota archaeon]